MFRFNYIRDKKKRQSYACNWPWRPTGLRDVEAPTFSKHLSIDSGEVIRFTH
jgi:hypothetical protein